MLLFSLALFADEVEIEDMGFKKLGPPWFTGPLIAPSGYTAKPGHFLLQPFFDTFVDVGRLDSEWKKKSAPNFYNIHFRTRFRAGVTSWLDVQTIPIVSYKTTQGKSSFGFEDLVFNLNFQLLAADLNDPWVAVKLIVGASIPLGKYQRLSLSKLGTDAFGDGSWHPQLAFVSTKLWHISGIHYLEARLYSGYRVGTPASLKGLSVYGGDKQTQGTAYPGNIFFADIALQYNLSLNWALACDLYYQHRDRSRFSGRTTVPAKLPSTEQFSLAPALEYNFKKNLGLIGGIWFTAGGRNTPQFINGLFSLNAYF